METVFSSAYCTIALTSASDWKVGFLERGKVKSYMGTDVDGFHILVDNGPLNRRAWVLQERALSRRTIFFTTQQTYWECGNGVRCENFTKIKW